MGFIHHQVQALHKDHCRLEIYKNLCRKFDISLSTRTTPLVTRIYEARVEFVDSIHTSQGGINMPDKCPKCGSPYCLLRE